MGVTKADIVNKIANSKEYRDICRRICSDNDLHEDLFQELIIILLEKEESKIVGLHEADQLKFFVVKILQNQWKSSSSSFYKTYKQFNELTFQAKESYEFAEDAPDENKSILDIIDSELSRKSFDTKTDWYENKIVASLVEAGSLRKLSAKTGISRCALTYSANNFKKLINNRELSFKRFMDNQKTIIELAEQDKRILFSAAQKHNLEPEKYMQKVLLEAAERERKEKAA